MWSTRSRAAGGLRADADPDRVNLAAPLTDGQRVVVPVLGQPAPAEVGGAGVGTRRQRAQRTVVPCRGRSTSTPPRPSSSTPCRVWARPPPLRSSSTVSPSGPFRSVDALLDVRGIGEAKLDALRDLVTVGAA